MLLLLLLLQEEALAAAEERARREEAQTEMERQLLEAHRKNAEAEELMTKLRADLLAAQEDAAAKAAALEAERARQEEEERSRQAALKEAATEQGEDMSILLEQLGKTVKMIEDDAQEDDLSCAEIDEISEAGEKRIDGWQQALHNNNLEVLEKLKAIVEHLKELGLLRRTRYNLGGAYAQSKLESMQFAKETLASSAQVHAKSGERSTRATKVTASAVLSDKSKMSNKEKHGLRPDHIPSSLKPGGL
jgi:hypothetical protein